MAQHGIQQRDGEQTLRVLDAAGCLLVCLSVSSADAIPGVLRWQVRLWALVTKLIDARNAGVLPCPDLLNEKETSEAKRMWQSKNYAISQVSTCVLLGEIAIHMVCVKQNG